jgi:hypothetical protein
VHHGALSRPHHERSVPPAQGGEPSVCLEVLRRLDKHLRTQAFRLRTARRSRRPASMSGREKDRVSCLLLHVVTLVKHGCLAFIRRQLQPCRVTMMTAAMPSVHSSLCQRSRHGHRLVIPSEMSGE